MLSVLTASIGHFMHGPALPRLASVFALLTFPARAWDISGHMIVAQVAYPRLNTNAAAHLARFAAQMEFSQHHFNGVNIAAWADEIKNVGNRYRHWHFIDLGCPDSHFDLLTSPAPLKQVDGDLVSALKLCQAVVKGQQDPLILDEATAVALLVHFVGDIHQPLHCSSHYYTQAHIEPGHVRAAAAVSDRGGNAIDVSNFKDTYPELHEFWDKAYKAKRPVLLNATITTEKDLETFQTTPNDPNVTAWTQTVLKSSPPASVSLTPDFEAWAKETHDLGCAEAYGKLPGDIETTPRKLSYTYVKNARKVAQERLCLAGFRLAALLNELYPDH
jgi:hypothetical protein